MSVPLEVDRVSKQFGTLHALRGVSFRVEPGEVFGYLGPNGAGKTTTLRVVLGLVRATSGESRIFGRPPSDVSSRASVGFLPGDLRLYGDLTASAILDYFARFHPDNPPVLRDAAIAALALDQSTMSRRVKFLSHGTRQKLGLIIAMQHDPALLLLDEPSNGLDPLVQQGFRELVRGFAARGRSVLFSSHVLSEVESVCTRVAILRAGEIVALETIDHLRSNVIRRIRVRFRGVTPDLSQVPGVARVEQEGTTVTVFLRGDVNPVLRAIAAAEVEDFVFPEPELEDIFLSYYRAQAADA